MPLTHTLLLKLIRNSSLTCLAVILLSGILPGTTPAAFANHLFGGELFYTHVSGNTYTVTMVLYGDCGNTSGTFNNLITNQPKVQLYNGTSLIQTLTLLPQPGSGVEVSPVCADEANNTKCVNINNPLPGVKKFTYATTVTLSGTSANWKFRSNGDLGSSNQAGRSTAITNIITPSAGSIMSLEATLNNMAAANSSPTYTTIPTPFFLYQ